MSECPFCGGSGKRVHVVRHKQSRLRKTSVEWCLCTKSKAVSESTYNSMLSFLGDTYMDLKDIDKQLIFKPDELSESPNLFIYNTQFNNFCRHIKSVIMKYRFSEPNPLIYCCRSIDLLHKFYVAQEDGSCQHLSGTNKFDLLIVTLDTKEKNNQLKTCVSQVVYNRLCCAKPTWLYVPLSVQLKLSSEDQLKALLSQCEYEYSEDLLKYIHVKYEKIILKDINDETIPQKTKSEKQAGDFRRTTIKKNETIEKN